MKEINNDLKAIQASLLNQLKSTNIEYIDLYSYADKINTLKIKKNTLYLCDDD